MTDWNAVSAFMANVVAWPGSQTDPGFVNLHYSMPNTRPNAKEALLKGMGWPFRAVDDLVNRAAWINTVPAKFKDVWFCTSLQAAHGTNSKGKPKAIRLAANALAQKAIWIDVDVGPPEPGKKPKYPDLPTAVKAILEFIRVVKLPPPSALVYSGGGLHVYWISKTPLTPQEWMPYAGGLKNLLLANNILCDTGLTTDIARILRVPGTFNHKYDPPKPVTLASLPLVMYDFATLDFLKQFAPPTPEVKAAHDVFAEGITEAQRAAFKNGPVFKIEGEPGLDAGIAHEEVLLKAEPIFKQCGFFREALLTGGANYDNALWMYSVLGATFMENGNAIAHAISNGHATYSEDDTQALYDRKVAERADRGIGYPSCTTIQGAGCKSCASCPLFAKGKSPLNIRPAVTATVNPAQPSPAAQAAGLPASFELNDDGIICKVVETEDAGEITTIMVPLFQCVISNFWLQKNPGEHLNFTMTVDKGFTEPATIDLGEVSNQGFKSYLGKRRVLIDLRGAKYLEEFFLSTIGKLRALAAAQQSVPFGWYEEHGEIRGFSFAGNIMLDNNTVRPCGSADPNITHKYMPSGTIEKWFAAAETVTARKRPELTTIMLMSFASPLLYLNGKNSLMLSAYGSDSGAGKSAAFRIGMAVWGHPLLTKGTESQTANNITTSMKTIRHLPFYWDEITDDQHREKVAKVMHEADGGKEKGRNLDGVRTQAEGLWKLMLHVASNGSYVEYLRKRNKNHVASLSRVLEWEVKRINGGPGFLNDADAEALLNELDRNHGHMGLRYAQFLAINHVAIKEEIRLKVNEVEHRLKGGQTERYWYTAVALLTLAAKYAQQLGVDVNPAEIETFMYKIYHDNLMAREEFSSGGHVDNAETILTRYLKERDAQERGVWTNYMHNKRGKPPKPVTLLKAPTQARNNAGGIEFRFALDNRILVIAASDFNEWLAEHKHAETQVYSSLRQVYNLQKQKLQICAGWVHDAGREDCIVLHIAPDTPLWGYMTTYVAPEEKEKMEAGQPPEPLDTGFEEDVTATVTEGAFTPEGLTPTADVVDFVKGAARG